MKQPLQDDDPGLPGLRTWPRVYVAVLLSLVAWVSLLAAITRMYP